MTEISPQAVAMKQRLGIVGNASALNNAVERALRVAPIDLSVLVTGESGTGKEFFPQIIHLNSARKHGKYIAVNCGAIPEGTIDSELFGHEKGAFTGAVASRKGYFEEASGGTIFLDEVAELPLTTQARLLRVLESGEFIKVGSSEVQKTNIRVVAATNVDMARSVAEGKFREDLYYRLSTVQISVPALRDRGSDILLLARKFASDFSERYRTPQVTFDDEARERLLHYRWPGNVRQLKNVVEQIALFEAGRVITSADIVPYLPESVNSYVPTLMQPAGGAYEREREMLFNMIFKLQREIEALREQVEGGRMASAGQSRLALGGEIADAERKGSVTSVVKYTEPVDALFARGASRTASHDVVDVTATAPVTTLEETEKELIRRSLERNMGRRKAVASELNISERTLYRKIKEYGLE
ncbi:sigma-54-dependent Fis family transcriptional regulator [Muribaculaceae bacterium Isolate-002 (NCI)]|nr:sigma-54-dependent Fis family transcriptional regulator [Muribaculaceae bacterium Isolate-002 (NCI)]